MTSLLHTSMVNKAGKKNATVSRGKKPPSLGKGGHERAPTGGGPALPLATFDDDDIYQEPIKKVVRPVNQLQLSEVELKEEHTRVLTANDPNVPNNISKYNYRDKMYKVDPPGPGDHLAMHLALEGCALFREGDEAKLQAAAEEKRRAAADEARKETQKQAIEAGEEPQADGTNESGKNQFNYSERAAQTFNNPMRERGVVTEPPPMLTFKSTVAQWEIYDSYMAEYAAQVAEQEVENKKRDHKDAADEAGGGCGRGREDDMVHSAKMGGALKILERMVNQNAQDEIFQDFKYWEDASDQFREGEGSLLPLWRFSTDRTKRKQVTALAWNPRYPDLFAAAYGSYDFMRQGSGIVCCFSLKNTSHPEYTFNTESGVMCLDFHPAHNSLLAVGCHDGTVMVFDARHKANRPIYSSSIKTGKHTDPVWQDDPEETSVSGLAGGCCFDFNRHSEHLFLVGTEEGKIHKCSKAYSGQYLETYEGHNMAVYTLRWNPFHPRVFVSCSADWTVKLWDHVVPYAIMSFDLGNAVGDVYWSPYSSTVFAAVTSDGKVHVFDLAENKHEPLCEQKVVKRSKLTHVCFNKQDPIIIVGDDRGGINSLKLSPNLRKVHEPRDDDGNIVEHDRAQLQVDKMERLLTVADTKPVKEYTGK